MPFIDEKERLEAKYAVTDNPDIKREAMEAAHGETIIQLGTTGGYHFHGEGFTRGEATQKEILADADRLGIRYENVIEALHGVLGLLDANFLAIYEDRLKDLVNR